jgi:Flp pilus assembly protein TadB
MPTPPASGPDRPPALSARERAILAGIEADLDSDAPDLARAMSQAMPQPMPVTSTAAVPRGLVHAAMLVAALFVVLAVTGLVPPVVWALLAALAAMVLVPWVMLRAFERFDPGPERDPEP